MTTPTFPIDATLDDDDALCKQTLRELERRGWLLASEPALFTADDSLDDSFCKRVILRLREWCNAQQRSLDEQLVQHAIKHEYCRLLHAAMSIEGSRQQGRAIQETINYGWRLALSRCRDRQDAESAILRAVQKTWLTINRCKPELYLAYFARILINEINQDWRKRGPIDAHEQPEVARSDIYDEDAAALASEIRDPKGETFIDQVLNQIAMPRLQKVLRDCLKNARQEHIILLHFFAELNPTEVARQLCIKVERYSVEKSRALKKIKECCSEEVAHELRLRLNPSY